MSKHKNEHKDSYKMVHNAIENIHTNFNELLKITKSIKMPEKSVIEHGVSSSKLFSQGKSDKFILESNHDRKIENLKQIINTLESITN